MLTMRFEVDAEQRVGATEALVGRILPPLTLSNGIAGVHLCVADEAISNVETAEKKARGAATLVPSWVLLIAGNSVADVQGVVHGLGPWAQANTTSAPETAGYRHEFTRLKTPWSAG
jgi:hypothetical protein